MRRLPCAFAKSAGRMGVAALGLMVRIRVACGDTPAEIGPSPQHPSSLNSLTRTIQPE